MSRRSRNLFETIRSEGGLLPADLLEHIAAGSSDIPGLAPADYHLAANERVGEAVARSWNRLLGAWQAFSSARDALPEGQPDAGLTREKWLGVLFQELGYGRLPAARGGLEIEGRSYPVSHLWEATPIHQVGFRTEIDRRSRGVAGAATRSPHSLVQELLNRSEEHLWGLVTNGLQLRILRDNLSLTRQAYLEFDLERMFSGEVYSDFALLWQLAHQSRVEPRADATGEPRPQGCWLESWTRLATEQGTRALERLRTGVEQAIEELGKGFLSANASLRDELAKGTLTTDDYYHELLRLVYRLLFLFVSEDRGLLLDPDAKPDARQRYVDWYGTARLRALAGRVRGGPHGDLWESLLVVMEGLSRDTGCPDLGLPALGSFLWSDAALPHLTPAKLSNRALLEAVRKLAFTEDDRRLRRVDWRHLGSAELGSVYESLLELHPRLEAVAGHFELSSAAGHARKTTGSYYTPDSLVQCLLDSALEPVLDEACAAPDPEARILALKVCDPACGSGHFLIGAAHRIARRLAAVRTGEEEPPPEPLRTALRDVIGRCLYGVDLNPMAVELCKVSLWLEAIEPGKPLSFLDHHIQCGNSLLGTTPALLAEGIPDDAWKPIEGDEKAVATALRKQNKAERKGQTSMFGDLAGGSTPSLRNVADALSSLETLPDDSLVAIRQKELRWREVTDLDDVRRERLRADAWCAAFFWPKQKDAAEAPTHELFLRLTKDPAGLPASTRAEIERIAGEHRLFHWHLAFPDVFRVPNSAKEATGSAGWTGGFDAVVANPPWEHTELKEKEFFSTKAPEIAEARTAAARKRLIAGLKQADSFLHADYVKTKRLHDEVGFFSGKSGRYPLCGRGRINTYAVFAELMRETIRATGRVGCIVPSGIATDDTTKYFFQDLNSTRTLISLFDFENRKRLFEDVDSRMKFCLLTMSGLDRRAQQGADLAFFLHDPDDLDDLERRFRLSAEDITLLNPNTKTCPIFRTRRDAALALSAHRRLPVLSKAGWAVTLRRLLNIADDSAQFRTKQSEQCIPLYEAKYFHHFDHRWITHEYGSDKLLESSDKKDPSRSLRPRYWYPESEVRARFGHAWDRPWVFAWRDISRATDERTLIGAVIPSLAVPHTAKVMLPAPEARSAMPVLIANLASFAIDYFARQKNGGTHMSSFIVEQLPVVSYESASECFPWDQTTSSRQWSSKRVLELTYTSWSLGAFASDYLCETAPFRWNEDRRFLLRCELDAAFFHLYGISREDTDYIMETFPIVKRKDEQVHGEYRTKHVILEIYDEMQRAIDAGKPYQTRLDPPPADPSMAHDANEGR